MPKFMELRGAAREIFNEILRANDPFSAVCQAVHFQDAELRFCDLSVNLKDRRVYSIAVGKASARMAVALDQLLRDKLTAGIITSSAAALSQIKLSPRWQQFRGGHPEPNEQTLAPAAAAIELLGRANQERALVIFLISGGGSAMIEWPINQSISLANLRTANQALINCGASIAEVNSVRRAFSAVKGGRLAARAPNCDQITLIISDVPAGEERNVASGPSLSPPDGAPSALEVIERYRLRDELPEQIVRAIESCETSPIPRPNSTEKYFVLLDNQSALNAAAAAARERGFAVHIAKEISDQLIAEGVAALPEQLSGLRAANPHRKVCLISGGEFSCPVKGDGRGGRNLETALRLAMSERFGSANIVALCAGTDGLDGNSPAAGAIIDATTLDRANKIGLNAEDYLRRSDSYSFFAALDDVIITGATGTNVRDVRILISD
jgi:hydroxypyruvate reductase